MHTQDMHEAFLVPIPEYASEGLKALAEEDPTVPRGPMCSHVKTVCHKYHGQPNGREKFEVLLNQCWRP